MCAFGAVASQAAAQDRGPAVPPPTPPATISRNDSGQATVRAVRIARPIDVDGRLDDEVYRETPPIAGFIEQEPREGAPASERTEAWIFFDDRNLYVSARCWDSHPERDVITEMRRDNNNITQNESFTAVFDTFLDRRNGFFFQTSPLGAVRDQAVVDDALNVSWNTVWAVRTGRFDGGWTLEMSIPFKSLRYPGPGPQVWGFNIRRVVKWKNEYSYAAGHRAQPLAQLGGPALRTFFGEARQRPAHRHADAAHDAEQPDPVQCQCPYGDVERATTVGVSAGKRTVRRLQRWPQHA